MSSVQSKVEMGNKRQRPNWDDERAYEISSDWSYRRWAWEFLRRNPEYQAIKPNSRGPGFKDLYARFGRTSLKPFDQHYDLPTRGDQMRAWLPERHSGFRSVLRPFEEQKIELTIGRGKVAVLLDLNQTIRAGKAAIDSMLSHVKADLMGELERYEQALKKKGEVVPSIKKPRRDKLLIRLRILDAMFANASDEQMILKLYDPYRKTKKLPAGDDLARERRKLSIDKKRAKDLMNGGYLELVPLDYLQDKTSIREESSPKAKNAK